MDGQRIAGLKGSWEWLEYASQLPAKPMALPNPAANGLVFSGPCILAGASVLNSATTAGALNLLDGTDSKGLIAATIPLAAGTGFSGELAANGVLMELGIFATITTATIGGAIYVIPLWHHRLTPPGE